MKSDLKKRLTKLSERNQGATIWVAFRTTDGGYKVNSCDNRNIEHRFTESEYQDFVSKLNEPDRLMTNSYADSVILDDLSNPID